MAGTSLDKPGHDDEPAARGRVDSPGRLYLWHRRAQEREVLAKATRCDPVADTTAANVYHELNTQFWYLLPPC